MDKKILTALEDALYYLENVADDRDQSIITYDRLCEVINILEEFIQAQQSD